MHLGIISDSHKYKYTFVLCSSTDIDRLAAFYQASKVVGRSCLCDGYQKKVLDIFTETAGKKSDLYKFIPVYYYKQGHIDQLALIKNKGFCMLIRGAKFDQVEELLAQLPTEQTLLIYSMWSGYIREGENQKQDYIRLWERFEHKEELHTSGHASPETLAEVCNLVKPATAIIPIHSEHSADFAKLAISEALKSKITISPSIEI